MLGPEFREAYGISVSTFERWVRLPGFPGYKVTGAWVIDIGKFEGEFLPAYKPEEKYVRRRRK
jgi:hypothetical protein